MNYLEESGKWLGLEKDDIIDKNINEGSESVIGLALITTLLFGPNIYEKLKNIKTDTKYIITDKEINKIPNYGYKDEKIALSQYAYYTLKINNAEKNTLIYNNNTDINKNVYLYKFNKYKIKLIYNGSFDNLCKKYNIKTKSMDETKLKEREKIYKQTVSLIKRELNKYKELKSKANFKFDKENYNNFINGTDNYVSIFYCSIWDLVPNPRSTDQEDVEYRNKIGYEPIQNIINTLNPKLPKEYELTSDGDWDDLDISLNYNGKISESYNFKTGGISMNTINKLVSLSESYNIKNSDRLRNDIVSEYTETVNSLDSIDESVIVKDIRVLPIYKINEKKKAMKESYAVDLDSLKYVVQNEHCSLEEASNLLKRINNIDEDCSLYCVLPKNINENMSIESFINLNNILNEAGIIPTVVNEKGLSLKNWKDVGKAYKYSDRYKSNMTPSFIDLIKNSIDNPTKTGKFENLRPRLLKMVDKCKTIDDVNYLKRDVRAGKIQLTKLKQNRPEIAKQIDDHIKWLETDYMKALNDKAKELKAKK